MVEVGDDVVIDLSGPCSEKGHVWPGEAPGPCLICGAPHYSDKATGA